MRYLRPLALLLVLLLAGSCTSDPPEPVRVGAIYPLSGTQGMGGIDEYHGVRVAAELVNAEGGIGGRPPVVDQGDVPRADGGGKLVRGSYGSTISSPAATAAAGHGSLFWETGAVGKLAGPGGGDLVVRAAPRGAVGWCGGGGGGGRRGGGGGGVLVSGAAPTGGLLGRGAIRFVADQL